MKEYGYSGLEIAPTRIFREKPYDNLEKAEKWACELHSKYGFTVPSMQSIWYGRQEKIFGSEKEHKILVDYTKKAIDFAEAIGCKNLVFGCPRNRNVPESKDDSMGVMFFKVIGDYAAEHNTIIAIEANPPIYNTNYINTTVDAIRMVEVVGSQGFRLNLDMGAMIENGEAVSMLKKKVNMINHVHISEPWLKPIERRLIHKELRNLLMEEDYQGYVSIEMGKTDNTALLKDKMEYVQELFR